jgi:hypothetical protein
MKRVAFLFLVLVVVAAGCGSNKKESATTLPHVLPTAKTPDEWATRVVNRFLRPLNQDLQVVSNFNNPQIRLFIASGNPTTLRIIDTRMRDLQRCNAKLVTIGPPPANQPKLTNVSFHFRRACPDYEQVAAKLLEATKFFGSGRSDVITRGEDVARSARAASGRAANEFAAGVKIAQTLPEFQRAGLKPSL